MLEHLLRHLDDDRAGFQRIGAAVFEDIADHIAVGVRITVLGR